MSQETWTAVDQYICDLLIPPDAALERGLEESASAGLPAIQVSPPLGKLLYLLAITTKAERILEIGTLGGYSTTWLAKALSKSGELITLEYEPKHAEVARKNIERAGFGTRVTVLEGPAIHTLPTLRGPFDFIFIDADKGGYTEYLEWAVKLSRPGTVIVADNVVRDGHVIEGKSQDGAVVGIQRFNEALSARTDIEATIIQTVGGKHYDGFALAVVR